MRRYAAYWRVRRPMLLVSLIWAGVLAGVEGR